MSKKWRQNKAWEDQHLVGVYTPLRMVLRVFSSIPTAIVLLLFVSVYATLASVPIGMIAKIPTVLVNMFSLVLLIAIFVLPSIILIRKVLSPKSPGVRFVALFVTTIVLSVGLTWFWSMTIWPKLKYDPTTGNGLMLFASFIEQYKSTTVRRLPWMEMTETQFYAWWPMRWALILFVINLIVATIRRIEFTYKNLGVLMVHTGIVTIALGSVFYQRFKLEGDVLLLAGNDGNPGQAQRYFYDREDVALYVSQAKTPNSQPNPEIRPLNRLPLYNGYSLEAGLPQDATFHSDFFKEEDTIKLNDNGREISQPIPSGNGMLVDTDIKFKVVGFTPYATLADDWVKADLEPGRQPNPFRMIDLYYTRQAKLDEKPTGDPLFQFSFFLNQPIHRLSSNELIGIEYTENMDDQRWFDLSKKLEVEFSHGLVIEIPGQGFSTTIPVNLGDRLTLGDTGWTLAVDSLSDEPPFPIITPGYEDASSSLAIVKLTPPPSADGTPSQSFDRWVYHRYPELNQDLTPSPTGQPARSDPNPEIRVSYIDATKLQIYLDEQQDGDDQYTRAIIRQPTGEVRVVDRIDDGWLENVIPNAESDKLDLHVNQRWDHAEQIKRPIPTPKKDQDPSQVGSYANAFVAIETSIENPQGEQTWSQVLWLPFSQYINLQTDRNVKLRLPDQRIIMLGFGRYQRAMPGFEVSLVDFEMISYDHRGAPRDYQSVVQVSPNPFWDGKKPNFNSYQHLVKLNAPLRAPFHWDPEISWFTNSIRRLSAGMNPEQFKLSQSGWDRAGWEQSQEMVDRGMLDKPKSNWTILGVGNNPGIHIIAFGSILMSIGIPWAFYFKPYLVRREKLRLAAAHAQTKAQSE